jgi:hypothetical protein
MKLPHGYRADLGTKLEDYTLNPRHEEGRHKARVFESVLGITLANRKILKDAILTAASDSEEAENLGDKGYGSIYVLRLPLQTDRGSAMILTAWIVLHGEDFPRLTTCYIL